MDMGSTRIRRTTLHDLKRAGQPQGGSPTGQELGRPNPSRFEAAFNYTGMGASEAKDRKINDRALRPRTYPQRKT